MRKRFGLVAGLFILVAAPVVSAQPVTEVCQPRQGAPLDYQACADASEPGSAKQRWALINLGTQAFLKREFAKAAGFYDAAAAGGKAIYSDANFHAFRAYAYKEVGRQEDALTDAKLAYAILSDGQGVPADALKSAREQSVDKTVVYALIIPILHAAKAPQTAAAVKAYIALPTDGHIGKMANKAVTLSAIGEHAAAIAESEQVIGKVAGDPMLLNNHCEILRVAGRSADALSFCDKALAIDSQAASTHHTRAGVLAALGRCEESRRAYDEARRLNTTGRGLDPIDVCVPKAG